MTGFSQNRGRAGRRMVLAAALVWGWAALMPSASGQAAGQKPGAGRAGAAPGELFFGLKEAKWLPKVRTGLLPDTGDDLEKRAATLAFRQRNQDAFGLRMYPREMSPLVPAAQSPLVTRTVERVTLNEALQTLTVTGVNLARREVLLGGRTAAVGDALHLSYKGQVFLAEILEVGPSEIRFRDLKRQENGMLPHTCVPRFTPEKLARRQAAPERLGGMVSPMEPIQLKKP